MGRLALFIHPKGKSLQIYPPQNIASAQIGGLTMANETLGIPSVLPPTKEELNDLLCEFERIYKNGK